LPELCRAAGAGLTVTGKPQPVGDDLALVIFQIVEEALTNVLRHAGRDAGPEVYLDWGDQDVELSVTNAPTGRPARPPQDRPAQGLDRIAAQAQSVDGQLETGPSPDGGFSVWARLPYTAGEEADRAATA
jgi:signal transduction histidine kinase